MEHSFMAADKREREKQVVALMISLYCRKKHHTLKGRLCPECEALLSYAHLRSDRCPFMVIDHMSCSIREKKKQQKGKGYYD